MMGAWNDDFELNLSCAKATNTVWRNTYRCQSGWWTAHVLATTTMLLAAVTSVILELKLRGPDLLGYYSTIVRDLRSFDRRYGAGSAIGGVEHTRLFRTLRLRLLDVGEEMGTECLVVAPDGTAKGTQD